MFNHTKFYPSIFAIILLLFSLCARGQYCNENILPTNLRNGLVTFFPFCNSVDDKSISPSTLVTNNVTFGPDRFGNSNSAAQFSRASSSYLFLPANAKFEQPSFTISLWFKTNLIMTGGGPGQKLYQKNLYNV